MRQGAALRYHPTERQGFPLPDPPHTLRLHQDQRAAVAEFSCAVRCDPGGGEIKLEIAQEYPLREAAKAHQALESRRTRGSTLLLPD
ncbi:MAG: zinc-binding dehydrogenase [Candidatus Thiodiazotropha sp.]